MGCSVFLTNPYIMKTAMKNVRRGYCEDDERLFGSQAMPVLSKCAEEIVWLLNRGYPFKPAVTFTANHYLLAGRQRNALMRMVADDASLMIRRQKQLCVPEAGCTVHIDAFNAVVLMETALCGSMILKGMDGCYRDLSGLAGTYAIIQNTDPAIERIIRGLLEYRVGKAVFWIDAPVSNSGRLKTHIAEAAERLGLNIDIQMVHNADKELILRSHVISGDSVVISECVSWFNLYEKLIDELENPWIVQLNI